MDLSLLHDPLFPNQIVKTPFLPILMKAG